MLDHCGDTQSHVCEAVGIAQSALSHVIRGRNDPQLKTFVALGDPMGYQVTITTKDNAYLLIVKSDKIEVSDKAVRGQWSKLERLAAYYSARLPPKEIDELCRTLDIAVEVHAKEQKKKLLKAG
jgi:transcriptional regulator with XRE-family HTH domain